MATVASSGSEQCQRYGTFGTVVRKIPSLPLQLVNGIATPPFDLVPGQLR
jgi:hypothetical protein